jgi:hypothetical protein
MPAYSFKKRFIPPIKVGLGIASKGDEVWVYDGGITRMPDPKRQTIRAIGKRRHARVGETVQLYYGMRTKQCMKIGDARCVNVSNIRISVETNKVEIERDIIWHEIRTRDALNEFARSDGFESWSDMQAFWRQEHGGKRVGPFVGLLIEWEPL